MFCPTDEKTPYEQGPGESYGHTAQSVAARKIDSS